MESVETIEVGLSLFTSLAVDLILAGVWNTLKMGKFSLGVEGVFTSSRGFLGDGLDPRVDVSNLMYTSE